MIPINRNYIYSFTEKDYEKYPNEKLHTGTFWKEGDIHEYFLYYNDSPILRTFKYWTKVVKEHRDGRGKLIRTISDKTSIDVFDMDGNKLGTKEIKILFSHNKPEDELPQLENEGYFISQIRNAKLNIIM